MKTTPLKLVTIVAEAVLAPRLIDDVMRLGASGYTLTDASGEGSRGSRTGEIDGQNIRLEAVVAPESADRILGRLAEAYFPNYAIIAWVADVAVVRGDKYA